MKINGEWQYLWRAVDQDGNVLDILVQSRRNAKAAKRFFRKLLKRQCARAAGAGDRQARQL
ncbi:transposase-like protein [Streptomyces ambofaciens]